MGRLYTRRLGLDDYVPRQAPDFYVQEQKLILFQNFQTKFSHKRLADCAKIMQAIRACV